MRRVWAVVVFGADSLVVVAAYLVLYFTGYGGDTPWWCLGAAALGCAQLQPQVQRWLAGGDDLRRRASVRMALLMIIGIVFLYPTGWGPIGLCGLTLVVAIHIRWSGPRVWRQGLAWVMVGAVSGQTAIALRWVPSYIDVPEAHFGAFVVTVLSLLIVRTIGRSAEERLEAQEQLAHAASHDALTGLVNRAEFGRTLDAACAGAAGVAVLFLDLDGFKQVNDVHGHEVGDDLLRRAADVFRTATPAGGTVGRFGGDEFGVVLAGPTARKAVDVAERILDRLRAPVDTDAGPLTVRTSIGVATTTADRPGGAGDLLRRADHAMYQAKRAGTHGYRVATRVHTPT